MKKLLLPVLLGLLGGGAGLGAGLAFRSELAPDGAVTEGAAAPPASAASSPEPRVPASAHSNPPGRMPAAAPTEAAGPAPGEGGPPGAANRPPIDRIEFVRLSNQFIVPVLREGEVDALVALSLGLETRAGMRETVFAREPKLRDAFLRVMFDHANAGGFDGTFTAGPQLETLRRNLWEAARPILGPDIYDILITDFTRQDA